METDGSETRGVFQTSLNKRHGQPVMTADVCYMYVLVRKCVYTNTVKMEGCLCKVIESSKFKLFIVQFQPCFHLLSFCRITKVNVDAM